MRLEQSFQMYKHWIPSLLVVLWLVFHCFGNLCHSFRANIKFKWNELHCTSSACIQAVVRLSSGPTSVTCTSWIQPSGFPMLQCVVSVVYCRKSNDLPSLNCLASFKMRTRLAVCVGTGVPHGHKGGLQGLEQGGAEERVPTETEERRQTGQPSKASRSEVLNATRRPFTGHL